MVLEDTCTVYRVFLPNTGRHKVNSYSTELLLIKSCLKFLTFNIFISIKNTFLIFQHSYHNLFLPNGRNFSFIFSAFSQILTRTFPEKFHVCNKRSKIFAQHFEINLFYLICCCWFSLLFQNHFMQCVLSIH
jgi:hypothetical protein